MRTATPAHESDMTRTGGSKSQLVAKAELRTAGHSTRADLSILAVLKLHNITTASSNTTLARDNTIN